MTTSGSKWSAIGDVVTGASHIRQGTVCQDALAIHTDETGFVVAAVADGHGSRACPYSDEGAHLAVQAAIRLLGSILMQDLKGAQFTFATNKDDRIPKQLEIMWKESVKERHTSKGRGETDSLFVMYGSTLNAVAATDDFVFFVKIGDGDILMMSEDGPVQVLPTADRLGEDTESLCMDGAWKYVRTQIMQMKDDRELMLVLASDGYSNSFTETGGFLKAGMDFFRLSSQEGLGSIKKSLSDWLRQSSDVGSGDDISLALVSFGKNKT